MGEFVAPQMLAYVAVQTELSGTLFGEAIPLVEATHAGSCPGLAIRLPPGTAPGSITTEARAGEYRIAIRDRSTTGEEAIAVPQALRSAIEAIRFRPDPTGGMVIAIELHGNRSLQRLQSNDPAVLLFDIAESCAIAPQPSLLTHRDQGEREAFAQLLDRAEAAIRTGDHAAANAAVAELLGFAEGAGTPRARELSGILAEREGRHERAQLIYTQYLADYPDQEAVPRITMRLGALEGAKTAEPPPPQDAEPPHAVQSPPDPATSDWRTSLRGVFSQFYLRDRSTATLGDLTGTFDRGFTDRRVNVDELLTSADVTLVATNNKTVFEARASAGYAAEFRPVQLTGSDRNRGSYALLDQLYLSLYDSGDAYRMKLGRQKIYELGIFGRFDGASGGVKVGDRVALKAAVGKPVWSERQTSLNDQQWFYALGVDLSARGGAWTAGVYWFDQRSQGEVDRQAIGSQFRLRGENWMVDGLVDYDIAFGDLNAAYLSATVTRPNGAAFSLIGQYQSFPTLTLTNAVIGQEQPRLSSILGMADVATLREVARDRTLTARSLTVQATLPVLDKWQLAASASVSSFSGDPGSLGIPAYLETGSEYRADVRLHRNDALVAGDTLLASVAVADLDRAQIVSGTLDYRLPVADHAYVAPRVTLAHREQKDTDGSDTTWSASLRAVWKIAPKVEVDAQVARISRDETYRNYDWSGSKAERSFVAHIGYTLRF